MMQDKISALIDGELDVHELDALIAQLNREPVGKKAWRDYQLISDAMNNSESTQNALLSDDFLDRFSQRLANEPVVLAPTALRRQSALHKPHKRLVAMSMAASVALVSATAWYASRGSSPVPQAEQIVVASNTPRPASNIDAVNPYLAAHQSLVGGLAPNRRPVILTGAEAEAALRGQSAAHH